MAEDVKQFTLGEVEAVLVQTLGPDEQALVINGLKAQIEQHKAEQRVENWQQTIVDLSIAYARMHTPESNDHNIEGWFERLDEDAQTVLSTPPPDGNVYRELHDTAVKLAAVTYINGKIESGFQDEIDYDFLRDSQVDADWLFDFFRQYNKRFVNDDPSTARALTSLEDLNGTLIRHGETWDNACQLLMIELSAELAKQGYQLPVLGEDGLYDEEREYLSS